MLDYFLCFTDIPLEAWGYSVPDNNDKNVSDDDDTDFDYNEDWFHHTDLATSSTSADSNTSEIQLNTAYHKLMIKVRGRQSRRENRDDTAGVEQKLLPPNIHKDKTRLESVSSFFLSSWKELSHWLLIYLEAEFDTTAQIEIYLFF